MCKKAVLDAFEHANVDPGVAKHEPHIIDVRPWIRVESGVKALAYRRQIHRLFHNSIVVLKTQSIYSISCQATTMRSAVVNS